MTRVRPQRFFVVAALAAAAFTSGCGEQDKAPVVEEAPPPYAFEKEFRVLRSDFGEADTLQNSPVLKADAAGAEFPTKFLQLQAWDEFHERSVPNEPLGSYDYPVRMAALVEDAGAFGDQRLILGFDLLSLTASGLFCLPPHDGRLCTFKEVRYVNAVTQMVHDTSVTHSPALMIAGSGLNRFADSDPDLWSGFVTWFTGTVAPNVDVPLTTAIDWEAFVAAAGARISRLEAAGEDPEEVPAMAYKQVWDEQFVATGIVDHLHIVVITSRPTALRVSELPDDYYNRLRPLIPENKPVAFLSVAWTSPSADSSSEAIKFFKRFRHLVAGLNVVHVAWSRLVDVDEGACPIYQNLGVDGKRCNDGLLPASGPPKTLWDEFLVEEAPEPIASE